jgi:hypothetical protein
MKQNKAEVSNINKLNQKYKQIKNKKIYLKLEKKSYRDKEGKRNKQAKLNKLNKLDRLEAQVNTNKLYILLRISNILLKSSISNLKNQIGANTVSNL